MTEEFQLNDDTYTGTKEVSENLKFDSNLLQEWINDNVKNSGKIEKILVNDSEPVEFGQPLVVIK